MKRVVFLFMAVLVTACASSIPTAQPVASSSARSVTPFLVPSIAASPVTSTTPVPSPTTAPTQMPTPDTSQFMPSTETVVELGAFNIDLYYASHLIALDAKAGSIYVSVSPSNTVVLNTATLQKVNSLPAGGSLSLGDEGRQVYVGIGGTYSSDGRTTPGRLELFTAPTTLSHRVTFSDTSIVSPYALADPIGHKVYIVRSGIFIADAQSLEVTGSLSGTVAAPDAPGPNYSAMDAAIDPSRHRLYVSLNNGIPGSNNGNGLAIYDLTSGQSIAEDDERSVNSLALDQSDGTVFVSRIYMNTRSIVKVDEQGRKLRRLDDLAGEVQVDHARQRVYVYDPWSRPRIVVLDLDLNYLGETPLGDVDAMAFAFDAGHDRLFVLSAEGRLIVLRGHGRPPGVQPLSSPTMRGAVEWIVPSPNYVSDPALFAAFATSDYAGGSGMLFQSRDEGTSWKFVAGLPVTDSVTSLAFSPDDAAGRTLFVSSGSPYGSVSSSGVYRSADGGLTWQPGSRGLTDLSINKIIVSPNFVHDQTVFANGVIRGLFRSEDGGVTWLPLAARYVSVTEPYDSPVLNSLGVSPNFAQDHSLLIGRVGGGLLLSRDRGESWTRVITNSVSRLAYASGSTVFAVTLDGVIRSDDGGESWVNANHGIDLSSWYELVGLEVSSAYPTDHTAFALATAYDQPARLYRTQDGGQSWQPVTSGVSSGSLTSIALMPNGILLIGLSDGGVVKYRTRDK